MNLSDFVDDEDIANAPSDDAEAFIYYARRADDKFNDRTRNLRGDNNEDWEVLNEARMAFHNYIMAIADTYDISPFPDSTALENGDYGHADWRAFKSSFDYRMTKLVHAKARATNTDGFLLTEAAKEGMRRHLAGLRKYVTETELPEKTKTKLLAKLDEFEAALHKRQMSMNAVYLFAGAILGNLSNIATVADSAAVHKLLNSVLNVAHEEVSKTEEVTKLMAPKPPLQLTHEKPAASRAQPKSPVVAVPRESFSADLEDEIPF